MAATIRSNGTEDNQYEEIGKDNFSTVEMKPCISSKSSLDPTDADDAGGKIDLTSKNQASIEHIVQHPADNDSMRSVSKYKERVILAFLVFS